MTENERLQVVFMVAERSGGLGAVEIPHANWKPGVPTND
jgi:hypothetical protein